METEREGELRNEIETLTTQRDELADSLEDSARTLGHQDLEIIALKKQIENQVSTKQTLIALREAKKIQWKGRRSAFPRHKWQVVVDADKAKVILAELFALRKKYSRYVGIQHMGTEAFLYYLPRKKTVQDYIDELRAESRHKQDQLDAINKAINTGKLRWSH